MLQPNVELVRIDFSERLDVKDQDFMYFTCGLDGRLTQAAGKSEEFIGIKPDSVNGLRNVDNLCSDSFHMCSGMQKEFMEWGRLLYE